MAMVFVQFLVVIVRYVFSTNSLMAQESIIYMFATSFMLAMAHTFMRGEHVFLDVLFNTMTDRQKAWVYLLGTLFLMFPTMGTITYYATPVVMKSWALREGGIETFSIPYVYLLKTVILIFCVQMIAHGVILVIDSFNYLRGKTDSFSIEYEETTRHKQGEGKS